MASRRRTSPKVEPLDLDRELDEMYSSAITRPNLGFLRVGEFPTPPLAPEVAPGATQTSTDIASTDLRSTDVPSIDRVSFPTGFDSRAIDNAAIATTSPATVSMDARPAGKWKLHRCSTVQDGHSANEQLLYEMLWRSAKAITLDERLLAISREDMASQTRITVRNVKGVLDRLIEKLAIDRVIEPNSFGRAAATYRIHSYRAILDRRRKAGLEWVTRANGVKFIASKTAEDLLSRPKFTQGDVNQPAGSIDGLSRETASLDEIALVNTATAAVSMDTRSTVPRDLGIGLRKINPAFDAAAAARLWRECQARVPDCTVEEVLHLSTLKTAEICKHKHTRNTIGLLLISVPEFFGSTIVDKFREEKRNQLLEEVRIAEENENYWRAVLYDARSTEMDRSTALQVLGSSTKIAE